MKNVKIVKNGQIIVKNVKKIYEDGKYCFKYVKVEKAYFIFECIEFEKKISITPEYFTLNFIDLLNYCNKDLEEFGLLLGKGLMC